MKKYLWRILILLMICIFFYAWLQSKNNREFADFAEPEVKLFLHDKNEVINLKLEDYILGTVAAEMPASFEMEALKAQAVCARTYALKKIIDKHPYPLGADLSDDIGACQAFRDLHANKNALNEKYLQRVKKAVEATRGVVILYQSQPIDALYHSCCGGKTDSGWGTASNMPYLRSVNCNTCKASKHYIETWQFSNKTINQLVGDHGNKTDIKILSFSPAGRANQISINGKKIAAVRLRQQLNLPSQWLSFHSAQNQTEIVTRGYGHGIGLCQYGANGMAQAGKNYRQILKKYYQDIALYKLPY